MDIKYKGQTSNLLRDISLGLGNNVDLRNSEVLLRFFFCKVVREMDNTALIELLSLLPQFIKPFCVRHIDVCKDVHPLFEAKAEKNFAAVFKALKKYLSDESLVIIYSHLPSEKSEVNSALKKEVFLAA